MEICKRAETFLWKCSQNQYKEQQVTDSSQPLWRSAMHWLTDSHDVDKAHCDNFILAPQASPALHSTCLLKVERKVSSYNSIILKQNLMKSHHDSQYWVQIFQWGKTRTEFRNNTTRSRGYKDGNKNFRMLWTTDTQRHNGNVVRWATVYILRCAREHEYLSS